MVGLRTYQEYIFVVKCMNIFLVKVEISNLITVVINLQFFLVGQNS